MDDYVGMILRDHGLWAGCMAGTYFYLKNINKNSLSKSLLWQFSFLFAGLFRPEALIFMISIPIFNIFFFKKKLKQKYSLKLVLYDYFLIFIIIGCFFILKITTNILDNPNLLGRINEFLPITLSFLNRLLTPLPLESSNHYMNLLIQKYPFVLSFFILCFLFVFKIFQGQGLLNTYLIYLYFTKKNKVNNFYLLPIYFLTLISLCLVCISFFSNFVLTDRYFIISHLWILIIISPILQSIFEKNVLKKNEIMIQKYLVILFLVFSFLNILFDSNHKDLEREAGSFLKELDINNSVTLINAHRIAYYAGFDLEKIINTSTKFSDKNQWIILNGKIDQFPSYLLSEYYVYEKFLHKNDGIFIFRKIS